MTHRLPPAGHDPAPKPVTALKLLLTLAVAAPGSYAVLYGGHKLVAYVGPFTAFPEVWAGVFAVAAAIGATTYQIIRHRRP